MSTEIENNHVVKEFEAKARIYVRMYEAGELTRDECLELIADLEDVTRIESRIAEEDIKIKTEIIVETVLRVISVAKSVL